MKFLIGNVMYKHNILRKHRVNWCSKMWTYGKDLNDGDSEQNNRL
jgi:hypothetical protein